MEAIRQRLLAEQMAAIDLTKGDDEVQSVQARDRHVVKPQVKFYNPAPSVPQAFRPPLAPQSNGYQPKYDGGTNNTFGSTVDDPYRSSKPIANAYYPQPGSVKHAPVSVKSSAYNGAYASQNTGAPRYTSQPSTFSAFDPTRPHKNMSGPAIAAQAANLDLSYDEPEPFDSVYGPRIDASERDRQLQVCAEATIFITVGYSSRFNPLAGHDRKHGLANRRGHVQGQDARTQVCPAASPSSRRTMDEGAREREVQGWHFGGRYGIRKGKLSSRFFAAVCT